MNEEEIRKRLYVCEKRANDYREVGNSKIVEKYEKEIYKWEELLNKLNPKKNEELREYKKAFFKLNNTIDEAKEMLRKEIHKNNDYYKDEANAMSAHKMRELLSILDRV